VPHFVFSAPNDNPGLAALFCDSQLHLANLGNLHKKLKRILNLMRATGTGQGRGVGGGGIHRSPSDRSCAARAVQLGHKPVSRLLAILRFAKIRGGIILKAYLHL